MNDTFFYKEHELESIAQYIYNHIIMLVLCQGIEVDPDVKAEIKNAIIAHNKKEMMIEQIAIIDNYKEEMNQFIEEIIILLEPFLKPLRPIVTERQR
jgi:hypothetical protein